KVAKNALPPGETVGASAGRGHRLRDGERPNPGADAWRSTEVVIVGGGAAGLGAGWRLLRAGFEAFEVLELEPVLGGTARSAQTAVSAHPWGAHYVNVPMAHDRPMLTLLGELGVLEGGTVAEQYLCREPEERLFYRGRWYEGLYLRAGATAADLAELSR